MLEASRMQRYAWTGLALALLGTVVLGNRLAGSPQTAELSATTPSLWVFAVMAAAGLVLLGWGVVRSGDA